LIAKEKKAKVAMAKKVRYWNIIIISSDGFCFLKIAYAAKKWHERKAEKIRKLEREEEQRLRKTAKQIGSLVHAWWLELSKVNDKIQETCDLCFGHPVRIEVIELDVLYLRLHNSNKGKKLKFGRRGSETYICVI
jgi:hypothetical protein